MSRKITKTEKTSAPINAFPAFVDAEKMFEKLAAITTETCAKAYEFSLARGGQPSGHLEDWLRAEAVTLRPAPVTITQTDALINVAVAVPGFKAEDIEVALKDDMLIVSGNITAEAESDSGRIYYNELTSKRFIRRLELPDKVVPNNVEARLDNGMLTLTLTKAAGIDASKVAVQAA